MRLKFCIRFCVFLNIRVIGVIRSTRLIIDNSRLCGFFHNIAEGYIEGSGVNYVNCASIYRDSGYSEDYLGFEYFYEDNIHCIHLDSKIAEFVEEFRSNCGIKNSYGFKFSPNFCCYDQ